MQNEILYKDKNGEYTLEDVLEAVKENNKNSNYTSPKISKLFICKRTIPGITLASFDIEEQFILGSPDGYWARTQFFDGCCGFTTSCYELNIEYKGTDKVTKTLSQYNFTFEEIDLFQTHRHIFDN